MTYDELYKKYYKIVCRNIRKYMFNSNDSVVEDLAQNVFLRIWEKWSTIDTSSAAGYLMVASRREALNYTKRFESKFQFEDIDATFDGDDGEKRFILTSDEINWPDKYIGPEKDIAIRRAIDLIEDKDISKFVFAQYCGMEKSELIRALKIDSKSYPHMRRKSKRAFKKKLVEYMERFDGIEEIV